MAKKSISGFVSEGVATFRKDAPSEAPVIKVSRRPSWKSFQGLALETAPRRPVNQPKVAPWDAVCLLTFYANNALKGHATGFLAKPDVVITAAHNVTMSGPDAIGAFPGFDAQLNPSLAISVGSWAWNIPADLAVLILRLPGPATIPVAPQEADSVIIPGYAFGYPGGKPRMTYAQGSCEISGGKLNYAAPVAKGDSGAPVLAPAGAGIVTAVHTDGRVTPSGPAGVGTRITAATLQLVTSLEAQARAALS